MSDLKINIHGRNDHNTIIEKEYPRFNDFPVCLKSAGGSLAAKNVRIVFEPSAVKLLFESISWGSRYRQGDVEQAGILIGNYYCDHTVREERIWADVVTVVPADPSFVNASFETIDITASAWKKMYEDAAVFQTENLQIIGWYHTHLNNINTRFSGLDRSTQRRAFTYEYSFGVVFNPNQEKWSAFYGPDSRECVGELLLDDELAARFGKPQITINQVNGDSELREDGLITHYSENIPSWESRLVGLNALDLDVANELSFGRLFGQFFSGFVQLIFNPKRRGKHRSETQMMPQVVHTPAKKINAAYDIQFTPHSPESRSRTPKIEIRNNCRAEPEIKCVFYSMSTEGGKLVEHPDFGCVVKANAIEEIMRYRQFGMDSLSKDMPLWSCVRQRCSGIEVLRPLPGEEANARVIFINPATDEDRREIIATGLHDYSEANIRFAVLVEIGSSQHIVIHVIQLSRRDML